MKNKFLRLSAAMAFICVLSGCQLNNRDDFVLETQEQIDMQNYVGKIKTMEKGQDFVVYEYCDVRVDQVSVLATIYCQQNGFAKAYLEKVNLYKNNSRRAKFYCQK